MKPQITRHRFLSEAQKLEIAALVDQCCRHDHTRLVYPLEERDCTHYLMHAPQGELMAVLAILLYPHSHVECSAFTAPAHRRKGYFYDLMNEAEDAYEDYDVMFLVDEACGACVAAMEALGADLDHHELQMELEMEPERIGWVPASGPELCLTAETDPAIPGNLHWKLFQEGSGGKNLSGSCQTLALSRGHVCLHHMEIPENLRSQGFGTRLLDLLKEALARDGITRILLQVSGDNTPAVRLYKKAGFRVTENLACYLY